MAMKQRLVTAAVAVVAVLSGTGCSKVCTPTVTPANANVLTCTSAQVAVPDECASEVTWSVSGGGTSDSKGLYSAPNQVPNPAQVTLTATAADSQESGSATLTVSTALPSTPVVAGNSSEDDVFHHQAAAHGKRVYAVQNSITGTDTKRFALFVSSSTDGGRSFSTPVKVNDSPAETAISCQAIAVDAQDTETVYVVYRLGAGAVDKTADATNPDSGATLALAVSTDGGKTFVNRVLESHISGFGICPDIVSPAPGAVLVSTPAWGGSAAEGGFTTYFDAQKGAGFAVGTWDANRNSEYLVDEHASVTTYAWALNDEGSYGLESPRLSTDGAGRVCITYVGGPTESELRVTTQCSSDKGRTFGTPVDVEAASAGTALHHPIGLFGPSGFTVAYWREGETAGSALRLAQSKDFGKSFSAPTTVPAYTVPDGRMSRPEYPAIAWDGSVLWMAYLVGDGLGNERLIVDKSCDGGHTWSGPQLLNGPEPAITTGAGWPTLLETDAGPLLVGRRGGATEDVPQQAIRLIP